MGSETLSARLASTNWSGEIDTGTTFTEVVGYWQIPAVVASSGHKYAANWIGIGGDGITQLIQTGTTSSTSGGSTSYHVWYELLPTPSIAISEPVSPGDFMEALIRKTSTKRWYIAIEDVTKSWEATGTVSYNAGLANSAEWITERPVVTGKLSALADFGSVRFHDLKIAGTDLTTVTTTTCYMVSTTEKIIAYPGSFYPTTTGDFTAYYGTPLPTVASVSPSQGTTAGGTKVTITGTSIVPGLVESVHFGTDAASGNVSSNGTITATAPAEPAGTVNVTVTTTDGTSAVTSADRFTYVSPSQPTVTSFSPSAGPTAGGTTVTITGTYLSGATAVMFGSTTAASYTVTGPTTVKAVTRPHAAGAVKVQVTTPAGTATSNESFTYVAAPSKPTKPFVVAGNADAMVSWGAPSTTGGSPIIAYTVTSTPTAKTCSTTGLSCTVTGLKDGTSYTFAVRAKNAVAGTGSTSTRSRAVTPSATGSPVGEVSTVGSFATYPLLHDLFGPSLNDLLPGGSTSDQKIAQTTALCATGVTYNATHKVPNGSTAGKVALHNEESAAQDMRGCIDFSSSISPPEPTGTQSTHFDYYADALDAVAPLAGSNAGGTREMPVTLSITTMKKIYLCKPGYKNWKTITGTDGTTGDQGGVTAPIVRFWPETGSGTRRVYQDILGFTPETTTYHTAKGSTCGTAANPAATRPVTGFSTVTVTGTKRTVGNEADSEQGIIYDAYANENPAIVKDAVSVYSVGNFVQQWNTVTRYTQSVRNSIDNKAIGDFDASTLLLAKMKNRDDASSQPFADFGAQSGTFSPTADRGTFAINTTVVKEADEWYSHIPTADGSPTSSTSPVPGVVYVFNVADTALPTYDLAKVMIGFDNQATGAKSALCNGDDASTIVAAGFAPLNKGTSAPDTSDLAGATCREFPGGSYPGYGHTKRWTASPWVNATG